MIMFQPWRYKLRQAQVALRDGRLEEAGRLLTEGDLPSYLPAQQLLGEVAAGIAHRGVQQAHAGQWQAAWHDLDTAKDLHGESSEWRASQQAIVQAVLSNIIKHLHAGDLPGAQTLLEMLHRRNLAAAAVQELREVAKRIESARKLAERGKFADAEAQLESALQLRPDLSLLAEQRATFREKAQRYRLLHEQLHKAMAQPDWTQALAYADEVLQFAPQCKVAREARRRAWDEVGAKLSDSRRMGHTEPWNGQADLPAKQNGSSSRSPRFLLWIDAVGGYLVCLGDEVTIGQASPGSKADIALQADISRQHAKLRRQGEGYVLEPLAPATKINGKLVESAALLSDGDEIVLGDAVQLRFRKPHALSASARLEIVSQHRTQPFADAVLLMAESCVLGPKRQNHVVCRDWGGDLVLFRQDGNLFCRAVESVEIDGKLEQGRARIASSSRIVGSDFSLSLEPL